jgi:hypothetical protein
MADYGGKEYDNDSCSMFDDYEHGLTNAPSHFPPRHILLERYRWRHVQYVMANTDNCNMALEQMMFERYGVLCTYCCEFVVGEVRTEPCVYNEHEEKYPLITKCQAMMQGLTRVERAWHYKRYLQHIYPSVVSAEKSYIEPRPSPTAENYSHASWPREEYSWGKVTFGVVNVLPRHKQSFFAVEGRHSSCEIFMLPRMQKILFGVASDPSAKAIELIDD